MQKRTKDVAGEKTTLHGRMHAYFPRDGGDAYTVLRVGVGVCGIACAKVRRRRLRERNVETRIVGGGRGGALGTSSENEEPFVVARSIGDDGREGR